MSEPGTIDWEIARADRAEAEADLLREALRRIAYDENVSCAQSTGEGNCRLIALEALGEVDKPKE